MLAIDPPACRNDKQFSRLSGPRRGGGVAAAAGRGLLAAVCCAALLLPAVSPLPALAADGGEAEWIWYPEFPAGASPAATVYFRKTFNSSNAEVGRLDISCDDQYELFVNGRRAGSGDQWQKQDSYDIRPLLVEGRNVIAVLAQNRTPGPAGLAARLVIRRVGNTDVSYSTDNTWKASLEAPNNWQLPGFDDRRWKTAKSLGEFGKAQPWGNRVVAADGTAASRFTLDSEFRVERVIAPEAVGSVIAMTFNERGEIISSAERGPLSRVIDSNGDGILDKVQPYSDKVTNAQGLMALNGDVFAVGDGPEGTGFYRLSDGDGDGEAETVNLIFAFNGGMGEHGPHAPVLGPDGLIYLVLGNHSSPKVEIAITSPHKHYYEGDLIQPRYEDAGGHAVGVKVPGGTVIRTDIEGSFVEQFSGGFRNAYDIAFNRQGELFSYDSDMEWDLSLPWYRPTRVNHVTAGSEFGWRSGWAKWPEYFIDSLPAVVNTGRGSPTGVDFYNHYRYPIRYQDALFVADWSLGRILVVRPKESGGSYQATADDFVTGRPLNVTDLGVGPDGWLYFSTGGRGTEGGIYRIVWLGNVPPRPEYTGIMQAIKQPQLHSAWGRNTIARIKQQMGDQWSPELARVADDPEAEPNDRVRAMDLMQLVGPPPSTRFLVKLSQDPSHLVRAKATYLMGIHVDELTTERLIELLADPDARVRRLACESIVRADIEPPVEGLLPILAERLPFVSWAGRLALQTVPVEQWQSTVLTSPDARVFLQGATALLTVAPEQENVQQVLSRSSELLRGQLSDEDFLDLLRVIQVAMVRGELNRDDLPELAVQLEQEYPAMEPRMNRELVRLLVALDAQTVLPRFMAFLNGDADLEEKLHLASHLRFLKSGWTPEQQLELLAFYEDARVKPGGASYSRYMDNFIRDFFATLPPDAKRRVLSYGDQLPTAALVALTQLPPDLDNALLVELADLDRRLREKDGEASALLSMGIVAVLGRSRDELAMNYLRDAFATQPGRRQELAMGLAQAPGGANWPLLVNALPGLEGAAATEVLTRLSEAEEKPEEPEMLRQVIMAGLRLGDGGGPPAVKLLEQWTGEQPAADDADVKAKLAAWQQWYADQYPGAPPAELPEPPENARWTRDVLLEFLDSAQGSAGDTTRGAAIFEQAQCVKCHRYGNRGEGIGPDLTTVAQRFQTKEILDSVLFPSQVISDQYSSKTIITSDGRTFTGIVGAGGEDTVILLNSEGQKITIATDDIEEVVPSSLSAMPEGLFDNLTLEQIADLFAYLRTTPR